ncbi:protein ACCELERATED CELL DEATH 6-like [Rhodamnia argentea]|uniref:Protein ACCELERATED CELL DEATH 6-like n=1 Tax=Rhodamnia argentea TaxID=178133 RepID=A0ABM3HMT6_9MYRT|nr:protein ACCELERATED CELL DEATH 6-like [Rhodamnia argentea]
MILDKEDEDLDLAGWFNNLTIAAVLEETIEVDGAFVEEPNIARELPKLSVDATFDDPLEGMVSEGKWEEGDIADFGVYDLDEFTPDYEEIRQDFEQHEMFKPLTGEETISINLGDDENPKEIKIGANLSPEMSECPIKLLKDYQDIFAWQRTGSVTGTQSKKGIMYEDFSNNKFRTLKLADTIINAGVEEFISAFESLANLTDSLFIFNILEQWDASVLHLAAIVGKDDILRLVLDFVPDHLIAVQNSLGNTPLHVAAMGKRSRAVALLIRRMRDLPKVEDKNRILRMKNTRGNTALHEAVLNGNVNGTRHLLNEDLETVYWMNKTHTSPLYLAIQSEEPEIHKLLFSLRLEPSRIQGLPPIHGAILDNRFDLAAMILKENMELFAMTDSRGGNVFHLAAYLYRTKAFQFLEPRTEHLARQWDMNGDPPIHIASKMGYVELIEKLLPVSPHSNLQGQNLLHIAAKYGRASAVRYMLRHPILRKEIHLADHAGNTPLHLAAMYSQPAALIPLVLDEGIGSKYMNHECLTAFDIALDRFRREPTLRKRLTLMVLSSSTIGKSQDLNGTFLLVRPEARDEAFSIFASRKKKLNRDHVKDMINTRLLVATLVATVTFAAGFAVPGGFSGSGMATMLDKRLFQAFAICNTVAMFCSMLVVINLIYAQQNDVEVAIAANRNSVLPLSVALPAMSIAFLTGVTLIVGKLPWLANTIFYLGIVFLLLVSGATLLEYPPLLQTRYRPIRRAIFWLVRTYIHLWGVQTYLLDDSEDDRTTGGISTSGSRDGDGDLGTGDSATAKCGDAPHPPSH